MERTASDRPQIALLEGLAEPALERVYREAQIREVLPNTLLFNQGAPAPAIHVLISGFAKLVQSAPSGACVILQYVKPGETFGPLALTGDAVYAVDAVAVTACVELQWSAPFVRDMLANHAPAAFNAIRALEHRLRDLESRLRELSNEPVETRIAQGLSRLVEKLGAPVGDGLDVPFPISRQDLADLTGTTLHTVSRRLALWEKQGLIRCSRRRITVTNPAALAGLARRSALCEPQARRTHRRQAPRRAGVLELA